MSSTVIVGASTGGARTALALRAQGYDGAITLVGAETELPYDRPKLSKQFLAGGAQADELRCLSLEQAADAAITMTLGRSAIAASCTARRVQLDDGSELDFDQLVVATGARARTLPNAAATGVHTLRTLADARAIQSELRPDATIAIVGAGFVGTELAATCRGLGLTVHLIDMDSAPMTRTLGVDMAGRLARLHAAHGVQTHLARSIERLEHSGGQTVLTLSDATAITADVVVAGIGVVPNDGWLDGSGIATNNGVLCDEFCRASCPGVYAVGDVARWLRPPRHGLTRVEHWTNAVEQANCVAYNIMHPSAPRAYDPVGYVWTDQYDWTVQIVGTLADHGSPVHVATHQDDVRDAAVFARDGEQVDGAIVVNWPRAAVACRRLVGEPLGRLQEALAELSGAAGSEGLTRTGTT